MKVYRATSGPFIERPYFSIEEIERTCTEELKKVGLFPKDPEPIRIDRFIEKRFNIVPKYEDLSEDVLGYTKFGFNGVHEIVISSMLTEENSKVSERRINSTLAHECGHGLFHAYLFALTDTKPLFGNDFDHQKCRILCRKDTIEGIQDRPRNDCAKKWWEYQANLAIGGLLLPRKLVMTTLEPYLMEKGQLGVKILDFDQKETMIRNLVNVFDVNPIVVMIRIQTIFPTKQEGQLLL